MPEDIFTDEDLGISGGLSDIDVGLDFDPRQMAIASRSVPMPGYMDPMEESLRNMVQNRPVSEPNEFARQQMDTIRRMEQFKSVEASPDLTGADLFRRGMELAIGNVAPSLTPERLNIYRQGLHGTIKDIGAGALEVERGKEELGRIATGAPPLEGDSETIQAIRGAIESIGGTVEGILQPEMIPLLFVGGLPGAAGKAATGLFMADIARHAPEIYGQLREAYESGDTEKEAKALTDAITAGSFLGLMGLHIAKGAPVKAGVKEFLETVTPEQRAALYEQLRNPNIIQRFKEKPLPEERIPNASEVSPTTKVYGDVRAQPREGAGEVPIEKGGEGVLAQTERGLPEQLPQNAAPEVQRDVGQQRAVETVGELTSMTPDEFMEWSKGKTEAESPTGRAYEVGDNATPELVDDIRTKLLEIDSRTSELMQESQRLTAEGKRAEGLAKLDEATKIFSGQQHFLREALERAEWVESKGELHAKKFGDAMPLNQFKGTVPEGHVPVTIRSGDITYEAFLASPPGSKLTKIAKIKPSGEAGNLELSHTVLKSGDKIVKGPKTAEEYQSATQQKTPEVVRETLGESGTVTLTPTIKAGDVTVTGRSHAEALNNATASKDATKIMAAMSGERGFTDQNGKFYTRKEALEIFKQQGGDASKLMKPEEGLHSEDLRDAGMLEHLNETAKEAAPAYENGNAAPSGMPGLMIDPFGVEAARLVGRAARAAYDSPVAKKLRGQMNEIWDAAAIKSAPKLTASNQKLGETAVRYASSFLVGRTKGQIFADKVLAGTGVDPAKFGAALTEDNLRSIAQNAPDPNRVQTLVGRPRSPFATEAEYQAFLNDPATQAAIERHKQLWAEQKDPLFRQANDLDPDLPLETRGLQTGARINLKALQPDEAGVTPVGRARAPGFRQLATLRKRDPFGRQAKGTGQAYEGNYHEIMANGFERELPVAKQHEFLKQLIENGDAVVSDKMVDPSIELKDENAKGYLLTLKPWTGKFLHVRRSLQNEFETISGLKESARLPYITAFNDFWTRQSVAGLAEGTTHASNLLTQIFTMPGPTANPMINVLLKSLGRADLLYSLPKVLIKGFTNQRERMLELAEIGAAKEKYPGAIANKLLNPIDQGVRIVTDDIYKQLADKGIVENSETARREFINQVGQYNKRLQPKLTRWLRESGVSPFITAGQTFATQGIRRTILSPGVKATSNARALALKADMAAGWIGGTVLAVVLNKLISGNATGPTGTPLGAVGWKGDDGKVHSFNLMRLLGYERGLRSTGILPYIEAKRSGLSNKQAIEAGYQAVGSTGAGLVMGPGPRLVEIGLFGRRPTQPWIKQAKTVPPNDSLSPLKNQVAENIKTAIIEANPVLSSAHEIKKGLEEKQSKGEIIAKTLEKQASRFTPRAGMTEQKARQLPKIVDSAQLNEYIDEVVRDARKLPLNRRYNYIRQRFNRDELGKKYRDTAWDKVGRKGVLKYN